VDAASDGDASTVRSGRNVLDESIEELEDHRISDRFGDENPSSTWGPRFDEACANRLKQDGMDANGQTNLASLLAKQRAATGVVPDDRTLVVERSRDEEGDWRIILHSPYGRRVHEPWALAVTNRLKRKYGYDGQVYVADDGMVVRLPEQDGRMGAADLFLFDADDLQHDVEQEIGDSVLFATRFRQCAARSLFMPRMNPGKRVPLWQQRLRASELLAAAKTQRNFPLLLETTRECLQDVYDMPALHKLMEALNAKRVVVRDVETDTPSLMAQNLLFGFVGSVMYEYDSPQAERRASVLSMDPDVLEDLLGQGKIADVLDPEVTAEVEHELADREFWNELADDDVMGRLLRFSKTHGPFTAEDAVQQLGLDVTSVVHGLDELNAQGKIDTGVFVSGGPQTQYINRDVFRRIRSRSLVKARKAVKPVGSSVYQSWLFKHAGIGDRSRLSGVDGVLRVIEQLEGLPLPANLWESAVFPARVGDFSPTMLDELLADGEVYWVGSKDGMSCDDEPSAKMMIPGKVSWYLAGSMLPALADDRWVVSGTGVNQAGVGVVAPDGAGVIDAPVGNRGMNQASNADGRPVQADGTQRERSGDEVMDMRDCIMGMLRAGGFYRAERLADCCRSQARGTSEGIEELVDPFTGELIEPELSDSRFEYVLWSLVWEGKVTNSSFAAVRALCASQGARGSVKRGGSRRMAGRARVRPTTRTPQALTGLWSAVHRDQIGSQTIEQRAVAFTEAILDRYGVVSPEVVDADGIAGGFKGIYPVLKRMEETGSVVRGRFIDGFSALQFATRQTVDELRQWHAGRSTLAVVVDAADPMSLAGAAIAWPPVDHAQTSGAPRSSGTFDQVDEGRESGAPSVVGIPDPMEVSKESNPQRASNLIEAANTVCVSADTDRSPDHKVCSQPKRVVGAAVVYLEGVPILYATPAGHHLIRFASTDYEMRRALNALADTIRQWYDSGLFKHAKGGIWFRDINGEPIVSGSDLSRLMRAAGFAPTPQGAKLYL
jgi:ATP-dependent helicase Lhr and Lhr-like helicase